MNREDKCISLDLAKQIAVEHERLGIVVRSEHVWFDVKFPDKPNEVLLCRHDKIECTNDFISFKSWRAYDTSELVNMRRLTVTIFGSTNKVAEFLGNLYLKDLKEGHIKE